MTLKIFLIVLVVYTASLSAFGFQFSPMELELEPVGAKSTGTFTVNNSSDSPVAIQVKVYSRRVGAQGEELRLATNDFSLFPPQLRLAPREQRNVKITWRGSKDPKAELAYRVIAEQLPVDLERKKEKSNLELKFLMKMIASVYVVPTDAKSQIELKKLTYIKEKDKEFLELSLANKGNKHHVLKGVKVVGRETPKSAVWSLPVSMTQMLNGENLLAGTERKFKIQVKEAAPKIPQNLELHFE